MRILITPEMLLLSIKLRDNHTLNVPIAKVELTLNLAGSTMPMLNLLASQGGGALCGTYGKHA